MTHDPAPPEPAAAGGDALRALDQAVHARLADASMGLSPIALALAQSDGGWRLPASPGRQAVLAQRAVYKIHLLTDAPTTFVRVAGGHNAGIVSEPGHPRRSDRIDSAGPGHRRVDPDHRLARAPRHEGSWWPAMAAWLKARSSPPRRPLLLDPALVLDDAPGRYVHARCAD